MGITFMQISDARLDAPASGGRGAYSIIRKAKFAALERAADIAVERRVCAFVITGDLVVGKYLSFETSIFLRRLFKGLMEKGIAVIYLHGDKDSASVSGDMDLPHGVIEFYDDSPREFTLSVNGLPVARFVGAGYGNSGASFSPERLPMRTVLPTIGLFHGVVSKDERDAQNDVMFARPDALLQVNYDMWAIGHSDAPSAPDKWISGCGPLTYDDYDDAGPRGVNIVTVEAYRAPKVDFVQIDGPKFLDINCVDIEEADYASFIARIEKIVKGALGVNAAQTLIRLTFSGKCGMFAKFTGADALAFRQSIGGEIKQRLGAADVLVSEYLICPATSPEKYRGENSMLGNALAMWRRAMTEDAALDELLMQLNEWSFFDDDGATVEEKKARLRNMLPGLDMRLAWEMERGDV